MGAQISTWGGVCLVFMLTSPSEAICSTARRLISANVLGRLRIMDSQKVMANLLKVFLNHVRDGAEAMDVCVQDPPKSYGDLEGA